MPCVYNAVYVLFVKKAYFFKNRSHDSDSKGLFVIPEMEKPVHDPRTHRLPYCEFSRAKWRMF